MRDISFTLNGAPKRLTVDERRPLLWVLRDHLGLTGTKFGCGMAACGACTVVVEGEAVRSCVTTIGDVQGRRVVTIEGLADGTRLHPIQAAFASAAAFQCGFCTPGMIMGTYALLRKSSAPSRDEIVAELDDHLCRCGAHVRIVRAVESAAAAMKGGER
jgi:aerobic-type carbon monoxide dehydrogenase small subunit (CoxS/CutS family)